MDASEPFRPSDHAITSAPVVLRAGRGANWERGKRSSLMRSSSWARALGREHPEKAAKNATTAPQTVAIRRNSDLADDTAGPGRDATNMHFLPARRERTALTPGARGPS